MSDLISKSELRHRICNGFISHDGYVDGEFTDVFKDNGITFEQLANPETPYGKMIELVIRIIESVPAVEPRRGKWVKVEAPDPLLDGYLWRCSKCGTNTNAIRNGVPWANYCPNCGADMRGAPNE